MVLDFVSTCTHSFKVKKRFEWRRREMGDNFFE